MNQQCDSVKLLEMADEAGAIYRIDGTVLINRDIFDEYLEQFHQKPCTYSAYMQRKQYEKSRKSKILIGSIRSFLKRRRMPMLNTEGLKRRTKNFRWQNTIWSGSWISRKKNKNKKKNNKAKADSRDNSLGVFHRN